MFTQSKRTICIFLGDLCAIPFFQTLKKRMVEPNETPRFKSSFDFRDENLLI
ncbi:MAG: hypothetical protein ACJAUD_000365 [Crocinitomicaceae bacterium]|jgi:hypothetical protein